VPLSYAGAMEKVTLRSLSVTAKNPQFSECRSVLAIMASNASVCAHQNREL